MLKGHRGRQYLPRSRNTFQRSSHSSQNSDRRNQAYSQEDGRNIYYDRLDEEERRFYELTRTGSEVHLWKEYKERVNQIEADLMEEMTYYQRNPDRHPKYEYEWNEYWNRRTGDILRIGEDPMKYNIKDEFFSFWDIKLRELFEDIFQKEKAELLKKQFQYLRCNQSNNSMSVTQYDTEDRLLASNKRNYGSVSQEYKHALPNKRLKPSCKPENPVTSVNNDVSVIPVLRQLSVLEKQLASLGPKVVDLLSKALLLEKSSSVDLLLSNEENYLTLETVKEKLKGLLQAEVMPNKMIAAAETAVSNITELLRTVAFGKDNHNNLDEKLSFPNRSSYDKKFDGKSSFPDRSSYEKKLHENSSFPDRSSYEKKLDEKSYFSDKSSYDKKLDEKSSFPDRSSYEKKLDEKSYFSDKSSYDKKHDEKSSFPDRSSYENKPYQDERKFYEDKKSSLDERKFCQNKVNPYCEVKKISYQNNEVLLEDKRTQRNLFMDKNIQGQKNYKVSEISYCIGNLELLSDMSSLEKTALAQSIASSLFMNGQTDILENDLLELIRENVLKNRKSSNSADNYFERRTSDAYQQRQRNKDQFSPAKVSLGSSSTIPSLLDIDSGLQDFYRTGKNDSSLHRQETKKSFYPESGRSSHYVDPVTYPLNANSYQSGSNSNYYI